MIQNLQNILKSEIFHFWLTQPDAWNTLDIDYEKPRVERLWKSYGVLRLSLHVIHPCGEGESLLHPHPWKSAIHVLPIGGLYEHGIGYRTEVSPDVYEDVIVCKQIVSGSMTYEMLEPSGIHYVRPLLQPSFSIMLSGPVEWEENKWKEQLELQPLSDERKEEILLTFKSYFL